MMTNNVRSHSESFITLLKYDLFDFLTQFLTFTPVLILTPGDLSFLYGFMKYMVNVGPLLGRLCPFSVVLSLGYLMQHFLQLVVNIVKFEITMVLLLLISNLIKRNSYLTYWNELNATVFAKNSISVYGMLRKRFFFAKIFRSPCWWVGQ